MMRDIPVEMLIRVERERVDDENYRYVVNGTVRDGWRDVELWSSGTHSRYSGYNDELAAYDFFEHLAQVLAQNVESIDP